MESFHINSKDLPLRILLDNVESLQLLQAVPGDGTTALGKVRRPDTIALATTVNLLEGTNTNTSPQVNLPRHGSYIIEQKIGKLRLRLL